MSDDTADEPTLGDACWRGFADAPGCPAAGFPYSALAGEDRRAVEAGAAAAGAAAIARLDQGKPKPAREPHEALRMILGPCPVHAGMDHAQIGGEYEWFCLRDLADTAEAAAGPDHEPGLSECGCRMCDPSRHVTAPDLAKTVRALDVARDEITALRNLAADMLGEFSASGDGHRARAGQVRIRGWRERAGLEG